MTVMEKVLLDNIIRQQLKITEMQFGFISPISITTTSP